MQRVSLPPFLSMHREEFAFLFWPAIVLSAGGRTNDSHDLWVCVTVNLILFALLGLVVGLLGRNGRALATIYICLCALLTLVEAGAQGFILSYFSWSVLIIACLVYWLPFWVVIGGRPRQPSTASVH